MNLNEEIGKIIDYYAYMLGEGDQKYMRDALLHLFEKVGVEVIGEDESGWEENTGKRIRYLQQLEQRSKLKRLLSSTTENRGKEGGE